MCAIAAAQTSRRPAHHGASASGAISSPSRAIRGPTLPGELAYAEVCEPRKRCSAASTAHPPMFASLQARRRKPTSARERIAAPSMDCDATGETDSLGHGPESYFCFFSCFIRGDMAKLSRRGQARQNPHIMAKLAQLGGSAIGEQRGAHLAMACFSHSQPYRNFPRSTYLSAVERRGQGVFRCKQVTWANTLPSATRAVCENGCRAPTSRLANQIGAVAPDAVEATQFPLAALRRWQIEFNFSGRAPAGETLVRRAVKPLAHLTLKRCLRV